jgi:RNA polymerase sigma-70 factor, ECF subfamily
MNNGSISVKSSVGDDEVITRFLDLFDEESFADFFRLFNPQLVAFFRSAGCELAQDLAQEVMMVVYKKAGQLRDRSLFRAWFFTIARNALCRHHHKRTREIGTVGLAEVPKYLISRDNKSPATSAFEFRQWMTFLERPEREALTLRFIEDWEYHEIAAAKSIPIGTVQWRVFNAKKKLAPILRRTEGKCVRVTA